LLSLQTNNVSALAGAQIEFRLCIWGQSWAANQHQWTISLAACTFSRSFQAKRLAQIEAFIVLCWGPVEDKLAACNCWQRAPFAFPFAFAVTRDRARTICSPADSLQCSVFSLQVARGQFAVGPNILFANKGARSLRCSRSMLVWLPTRNANLRD